MEQETIIIVSVFSAVCLLLLILVGVLFGQLGGLRRRLDDMADARLRVQKLKMENDRNHAFHNPVISPDEELAKRGFSMYAGDDLESGRGSPRSTILPERGFSMYAGNDVDSGRGSPRQTGGQFVEELARELDHRQQRQHSMQQLEMQQFPPQQLPNHQQIAQPAPPFLLQSIEENKRRSRQLANPVANGRQSDTNPNFIY